MLKSEDLTYLLNDFIIILVEKLGNLRFKILKYLLKHSHTPFRSSYRPSGHEKLKII